MKTDRLKVEPLLLPRQEAIEMVLVLRQLHEDEPDGIPPEMRHWVLATGMLAALKADITEEELIAILDEAFPVRSVS